MPERQRWNQSRIGRSAPSLTRSRRSLPGLKCGTYFPESATASPVLGLRPCRGGRKCREKLPKPRISMRSPCESASLMISSICFSASSTSLAGRCFCFAVMISMSSDFVIVVDPRGPSRPVKTVKTRQDRQDRLRPSAPVGTDLLLEEIPEARARGRSLLGTIALHRLGFLVHFLRLDRQRDRARLAIVTGALRLHLVAHLQHRACVLDSFATELRCTKLALDTVAQIDDPTARVHVLDGAAHDRAFRVLRDPRREGILRELLDAERDALALRIDGQHHGLDLLGFLEIAHGLLAGHVPADVGEVHETVDAA